MERVVPWPALCGLIEPFYPKAGNGRPPVGVERMLRIYFLQQWFNLSDPAVEEALCAGFGGIHPATRHKRVRARQSGVPVRKSRTRPATDAGCSR